MATGPLSPLQDTQFYDNLLPDYLEKSFASQMIRYAPNGTAPIFGLTGGVGSGKTLNVLHSYFTKTAVFPHVIMNGAVDDQATTLTVQDTSTILPADMLRVSATGEVLRVDTIGSATSITVSRAVGGVAAGSIADGVRLSAVGNAHEQASERPRSRLINPEMVSNNTQIFRNTWALPRSVTAIQTIVGGSTSGESRDDCGFFHASDIEKALLFGQRSVSNVNGQVMTTMDGIVESVRKYAPAENTSQALATTNFDQLEEMLNPVFATTVNGRNSDERLLFCGLQAQTVINNIGRLSGQYQLVDGQTNFGLKFKTFQTSQGVFHIINHPILNTDPNWSKMAIALDMSQLKLMYLGDRKTLYEEFNAKGQAVDYGVDAEGGTLTTECTLELLGPSNMAVVSNLTAAEK